MPDGRRRERARARARGGGGGGGQTERGWCVGHDSPLMGGQVAAAAHLHAHLHWVRTSFGGGYDQLQLRAEAASPTAQSRSQWSEIPLCPEEWP